MSGPVSAGRLFVLGAVVAVLGCVIGVLIDRDVIPRTADVAAASCAGFALVCAIVGAVCEDRVRPRAVLTFALAIAAFATAPILATLVLAAKAALLLAVALLLIVVVLL